MQHLSIILLCVIAIQISFEGRGVSGARIVVKREVEKYNSKYDNIDIKSIVASRRLMTNYVNCLLDKGPCSPEGRLLKTYLPEAMQTKCAKCTQKQKAISGILLAHLVENYRDMWNNLLNKYDPDGSFRKQYEGSDDEEDEEEEEEAAKK